MGADWGRARVIAPVQDYSTGEWVEYWNEHPDVFTQVLGDVYRVYKSEERRKLGTANPKGGRRKSTIDGNLDELWRILTPRFSVDPFPVAFAELLGKRSLRQVELHTGVRHASLSRWATGKREPEVEVLEALAKYFDVHPAYFLEWRVAKIQGLVATVLASRPNLSITLLKALS
jgi:hypothetical protein